MVALLVAALAAASVSAATSSQKSTKASGKGWELKAGHVNSKGQNLPAKLAGTGQFKPTKPNQPKFINSPTPANAKSILSHDKAIPGKLGANGGKAPSGSAASGPGAPFIPHAHSLPIVSKSYAAQAKGLNAYNQDSVG